MTYCSLGRNTASFVLPTRLQANSESQMVLMVAYFNRHDLCHGTQHLQPEAAAFLLQIRRDNLFQPVSFFGAWVFCGYDASTHLAEEMKQASTIVAKESGFPRFPPGFYRCPRSSSFGSACKTLRESSRPRMQTIGLSILSNSLARMVSSLSLRFSGWTVHVLGHLVSCRRNESPTPSRAMASFLSAPSSESFRRGRWRLMLHCLCLSCHAPTRQQSLVQLWLHFIHYEQRL